MEQLANLDQNITPDRGPYYTETLSIDVHLSDYVTAMMTCIHWERHTYGALLHHARK